MSTMHSVQYIICGVHQTQMSSRPQSTVHHSHLNVRQPHGTVVQQPSQAGFVCMWLSAGEKYKFHGDETLVNKAIDYLYASRRLRESIREWQKREGVLRWDGRTAHPHASGPSQKVPDIAWRSAPLDGWIHGVSKIITWYKEHVRFGDHVSHNKYGNEVRLTDGGYWREKPSSFPWLTKNETLMSTLLRQQELVCSAGIP